MPNQNNEQGNQNTLPISHEQVDQLKNQAEEQGGNILCNLGNSIGGIFGHHNEEKK